MKQLKKSISQCNKENTNLHIFSKIKNSCEVFKDITESKFPCLKKYSTESKCHVSKSTAQAWQLERIYESVATVLKLGCEKLENREKKKNAGLHTLLLNLKVYEVYYEVL